MEPWRAELQWEPQGHQERCQSKRNPFENLCTYMQKPIRNASADTDDGDEVNNEANCTGKDSDDDDGNDDDYDGDGTPTIKRSATRTTITTMTTTSTTTTAMTIEHIKIFPRGLHEKRPSQKTEQGTSCMPPRPGWGGAQRN